MSLSWELLGLTFGFGVISSSVPVFNMEAYLLVIQARAGGHGVGEAFWLALVGSTGQNLGKLVWYYACREAVDIGWVQRRIGTPKRQAQMARWRGQVEGRPVASGALNFVSAAIGFPPFFVMAILAGTFRMNVAVFGLTGIAGRTLFFWALLLGLGLVLG